MNFFYSLLAFRKRKQNLSHFQIYFNIISLFVKMLLFFGYKVSNKIDRSLGIELYKFTTVELKPVQDSKDKQTNRIPFS